METCYIFGAGDFTPCTIDLTSKDLVIAADGGYDYLIRLGLRADVVLGDFDSVTSPDLWDDAICEKLTYPPEKDDTDMMLAIKLGLSRGYREFAIYGGMPFLAVVSLLTPSGNALVSVTPSTSYFKPLIDTFSLESLRENTDTMPVASFGTVKLLSLMTVSA